MPNNRTKYEIAIISPTGEKTLLVYNAARSFRSLWSAICEKAEYVNELTSKPLEWCWEKGKLSQGITTECGWACNYTGRTMLEAKSASLGSIELPFIVDVVKASRLAKSA